MMDEDERRKFDRNALEYRALAASGRMSVACLARVEAPKPNVFARVAQASLASAWRNQARGLVD
jgi:hypothetical protein